jgi:Mg2+/Co2+ transporter CorC
MPRRGDVVVIDRFEIEVQRADARQVHVLMVRVLSDEELAEREQQAEHHEHD